MPSTAWVGSQGSLPCLPPSPERGAVPGLLRERSLQEQLPAFPLPTSTSSVDPSAWPPVRSSCRQPGAAPNGLPGDLGSDSWVLTAPCNRSLQLPGPPLSPCSDGEGCSALHGEEAGSFFSLHQVFVVVLEGCGTHCLGGRWWYKQRVPRLELLQGDAPGQGL